MGKKLLPALVSVCALAALAGPGVLLSVTPNQALRHRVLSVFDQTFQITWVLQTIAVFVSVLGVISTLTTLVLQRRREFAVTGQRRGFAPTPDGTTPFGLEFGPLLEAAGLTAASAVWIASLKGFAQFGGRVVEITFGRNLRAITVARIALGVLPLSFLVLLAAGGKLYAILLFTLLMGAAQGVITIVRGAVPLALFGAEGYGAVLGMLATPFVIVNATAPAIFALVVDRWGWPAGEWTLLGTCATSWIAMELMARWYARARRA